MADDSGYAFTFPAIRGRKITAAFDGERLTSDGGVLLLAQAERRLGIADRLAACIADPRDQGRVIHRVADILRARMLAIPAVMRTPTISTRCATILGLSWRLENCRVTHLAWQASRL